MAVAPMLRQTLHVTILVILLGGTSAALAQEPEPAIIRAAVLAEEGGVNLVLGWRFQSGDDPRWASPAFDDRDWELVEPRMPPGGQLPRQGRPGTGWFRRRLRVEPALLGKPLVIRVGTPGATTVFLDGAPLMDIAAPGPQRRGGAWQEVILSPRPDHVLAVRHTFSLAGRDAPEGDSGFLLSLERPDAEAIRSASERRRMTLSAILTAVPAFLALFHFALFLSYPKARENLFYALFLAASAAIMVSDWTLPQVASGYWSARAWRLEIASVLATIFFGLLTYYALRTRVFPRTWIAFTVLGAALMSLILFYPNPPAILWTWPLYFGLMVVEIVRVETFGQTVQREGMQIVLGGFTVLGVVLVLVILGNFQLVPFIGGDSLYMVGMFAFLMSMSLFLARSFARTSLHLERRLGEVHELSQQILAQERTALDHELRRRLLEAENARKTAEIEAARTLQLSMLPGSLPDVKGLETAAVMVTASEVGGDYYDFRAEPEGSLVVAFGDATGHGLAAGTMVTAVKALFSTLGGGKSLTVVLAECDRVLREMQVKPLHMCLTLARVTPRSITVSSAAMPPVLLRRADTGEIEEVGTSGRPIGSRLVGAWSEHSVPLAPGDTLLFASDGFAEQLDPADQPLGYEALAEVMGAAARLPARALLERLLAHVAAWRGERKQEDDITFVAIRVR